MKITITRLLAAMLLASSALAFGAAPLREVGRDAKEEDDVCKATPENGYRIPAACSQPPRLRPYDPVYVVYQKTQDDHNSFRLHYSLRYTFFMPDCLPAYREALKKAGSAEDRGKAEQAMRDCMTEYTYRRAETYAMFTGEFDFYMGTRESGPVVNRISNPGLHRRWRISKKEDEGKFIRPQWVDIGIEHRSDGQTTDPLAVDPATGRYRAAIEYEQGNRSYIDSISQDTNFVVVEANFDVGESWEIWARWKPVYFSNDEAITWGPNAAQNPKIEDYDRLRLLVAYRLSRESVRPAEQRKLFFDWTLGERTFRTDSFNFGAYLPFKLWGWNIPLFVRAHRGPLNTLSDFARKQNSFGVGLLLVP